MVQTNCRKRKEMNNLGEILSSCNTLLDIGANVGSFSQGLKHAFPNIEVFMLEANPFCDAALSRTGIPYDIVCLSDTEKEVKFYFQQSNFVGTGASYYIEKTEWYNKDNFTLLQTKLLDDVILAKYGEHKQFDFIKMDTQGSELDILRGGKKTAAQAKYILIETSIIEYNENAPLKNEVIDYMSSIGFKPEYMLEQHYHEGALIQEDWIFTR